MINETMIQYLEGMLKRIFCQKITRSTIRELQNGLMACTKGDKDLSSDLLEALFSGQLQSGFASNPFADRLKKMVQDYSIQTRVAKEIFERGEFVTLVTSDLLMNEAEVAFANRVKRIDGEEFAFLSDPVSTLQILHHFTARLQELQQKPEAKELFQSLKADLLDIKERIGSLTV